MNYLERVKAIKESWTEDQCAKSVLSALSPEGLAPDTAAMCAKSPFQPNILADHLLSRFQAGSQWLTDQHQAWLEGRPDAASDERFSAALAAWGEMERSLRLVFDYRGCVFTPDQRCPEDATIICDFCAEERAIAAVQWAQQTGVEAKVLAGILAGQVYNGAKRKRR